MEITTPEIMIMGGLVIKYVIDIFSPLISEKYRTFIRPLAILLGVGWAFLFLPAELYVIIYQGVLVGASAIWVNEVGKVFVGK